MHFVILYMKDIDWDLTPKEAVALQHELRKRIKLIPLVSPIRSIAGADMSMNLYAKEGFAGFVTLSYPTLEPITHSVIKSEIRFPYIPGLLSFREIPMLLKAWDELKEKPDLIMVDGVGIAHPRRLGIASHLGLILGVPTIGCAKSKLTGNYEELGEEPGSCSYLRDKGETIGAVLRTKRRAKPLFISPGHLITLEESLNIVKTCLRKHRLPEPTQCAHRVVNEYRLSQRSGGQSMQGGKINNVPAS